MLPAFLNLPPQLRKTSLRWAAICVAAAGMTVCMSSASQASIAVPPQVDFSSQNLVAADFAGSGAAPADQQNNERTHRGERDAQWLAAQAPFSSSGGTSTASSVGVGAGMGACAFSSSAMDFSDPAISGWVSGASRLSLPRPPTNSLLRPPQG